MKFINVHGILHFCRFTIRVVVRSADKLLFSCVNNIAIIFFSI